MSCNVIHNGNQKKIFYWYLGREQDREKNKHAVWDWNGISLKAFPPFVNGKTMHSHSWLCHPLDFERCRLKKFCLMMIIVLLSAHFKG